MRIIGKGFYKLSHLCFKLAVFFGYSYADMSLHLDKRKDKKK